MENRQIIDKLASRDSDPSEAARSALAQEALGEPQGATVKEGEAAIAQSPKEGRTWIDKALCLLNIGDCDKQNSASQDALADQTGSSSADAQLLSAIEKRIGQELGGNKRLGCAVAVSQVLHELDPKIELTNNNRALERNLQEQGYASIPLEQAQQGDVIIGKRPHGMPGHAAIYTGDGHVFNNNSDKGKMQIDSVDKFNEGMHDAKGKWNPNGYSEVVVYRKVNQSITSSSGLIDSVTGGATSDVSSPVSSDIPPDVLAGQSSHTFTPVPSLELIAT